LLPERLSQHVLSWCVGLTLEQAWKIYYLLIEFADSFSKREDERTFVGRGEERG